MTEPLDLKNINKKYQDQDIGEILFSWRAAFSKEIDKRWLLGLLGSCLFLIIIAIWRQNFVGAVCLLIIGFLVYFLSNKEEEEKYFIIRQNGIQVGRNELFRFEKLDSFCFFENPLELYVRRRGNIGGNIVFPIKKEDLYKIRNILLKFLPEEEIELGFIDILRRKIGI